MRMGIDWWEEKMTVFMLENVTRLEQDLTCIILICWRRNAHLFHNNPIKWARFALQFTQQKPKFNKIQILTHLMNWYWWFSIANRKIFVLNALPSHSHTPYTCRCISHSLSLSLSLSLSVKSVSSDISIESLLSRSKIRKWTVKTTA